MTQMVLTVLLVDLGKLDRLYWGPMHRFVVASASRCISRNCL